MLPVFSLTESVLQLADSFENRAVAAEPCEEMTMAPNKIHKIFQFELLDEPEKNELQILCDRLENELEIEGLSFTLFYVIMELISNAVRANIKRVFFHKHHFTYSDLPSYEKGLEAFRAELDAMNWASHQEYLRQQNLSVRVETDLDDERLLVYVENNAPLFDEEELRIREKLAESMIMNDLADFSTHFGDDTEGKGLGLAMVVSLIRDLGFDPDNFRVFHDGEKTTARIEFPLAVDYTPIRKRNS